MRTYLLIMFYPSLAVAQESVRHCQDAVKKIAGNDWKLLKAGINSIAIAFATDIEPDKIQGRFNDAGRDNFHFLIVEISQVTAGWIERTAYEWIRSRLVRD
jgi:hypothetical protein